MSRTKTLVRRDALYGEMIFDDAITRLINQPLVQRLRDIRLSNIDSVEMPGIANISRFEHAIGTAFLASNAAFAEKLSSSDKCILQAAALLHDSAIQPFGHLIEESLAYLGRSISHEERWRLLATGNDPSQVGGIDLQVFMGRQSGLSEWATCEFGIHAKTGIKTILDSIAGCGEFGSAICGALDLDNLDNVARAAYHIGIDVDRMLPIKIAKRMLRLDANEVVFANDSISYVEQWRALRSNLYRAFMLSRPDFAGKVMMISSVISAYQHGYLTDRDWLLTDRTLLTRLIECGHEDVCKPIKSWLCGEFWMLSDLFWIEGGSPNYDEVFKFSNELSASLRRKCIAYRISDKMSRKVTLRLDSGNSETLGGNSNRWLLGVGSPIRKSFTTKENTELRDAAVQFFGAPAAHTVNDLNEKGVRDSRSLFEA